MSELVAQVERHESIEDVALALRGVPPPDMAVTMKLRRVLLLQDGTNPGRQDISVARINSITEGKKARGANWYLKLQNKIHPAHYLVPADAAHGTTLESYVDLLSVMTIHKDTIHRRTGGLNDDEMRDVSEIVIRTLELDITRQLEALRFRAEQPAE